MGILRSDRVSGLGGANAINGSAFFPQNSYINVEPDSDLDLSGDFTVEMWVRNLAGPEIALYQRQIASKNYFQSGSDGNWYFGLNQFPDGELYFYSYDGQGSAESLTGNIATPDLDRWYHIAAARSGSTLKMFLDGSEEASGTVSKGLDDGGNNGLFIGGISKNKGTDSYGDHYGWISNLRIIKGRALYTADFTVPTGRLEKTSDTVLLCFQSPGDVLEEKTGKILSHNNHDTTGASKEVSANRLSPDVGEDHGTTFTDNTKFDTLSYMVPPGGTTTQSNRGRGVVLGGGRSGSPTKINTISYIEIQSTGISNDFGDLTESVIIAGCCASSTRGVRGGGYNTPTNSNVIDYVTIATTSNATNFGDLTIARHWVMGGGSQTRGIFGGGNMGASPNPNSNTIDYITIASEGNAADFGDLINSYTPTIGSGNGAASPTRLLFAGGSQDTPAPQTVQNAIQYVTIASTGDATDFGDLTDNKVRFGVCSSSTRALYGGAGATDSAKTNSITYVTISTTGNTVDFGDRTVSVNNVAATSNSIRGVFIGGLGSPTSENHIDYVTIATTGNAVDWGDSFYVLEHTSACSDSHGGIS